MISPIVCTLLLLGVCMIECQYSAPRCDTCKYTPGHSFINHTNCGTYIKCSWNRENPDTFEHQLFCCDDNMVFDEMRYPPSCFFQLRAMTCNPDRYYGCPPAQPSTCPFRPHMRFEDQYLVLNFGRWEPQTCGEGTIYDQNICACTFPPAELGDCGLMLEFDFELNVLSTACDLYVTGIIYGDAYIAQGIICFSGNEQFFEIDHLMKWFESERYEFSVSFWFNSHGGNYFAGLFSSNCVWRTKGSPVEIMLIGEELNVVLGDSTRMKKTGQFIEDNVWYHTAVTYNHGEYKVYFNGQVVYEESTPDLMARTFTHATMAYVERDMFFNGCMDDFLFYTNALDEEQMHEHFVNRTRFGKPVPTTTPTPDFEVDFDF